MARRYAQGTEVPVESSQAEIVSLLKKGGVQRHAMAYDGSSSFIQFELDGRWYKLSVTTPSMDDDAIRLTPSGYERDDVTEAYQKEVMRRWRSLVLLVKAKIVASAEGASTAKDEWFPYLMLPNGETMAQFMEPQVEQIYLDGKMPDIRLLSG